MSENETIHFEENEYRALETIAEKTGFKNVQELVNTAIVLFFVEDSGLSMQPEKAKEFAKYFLEERCKNPNLDIEDSFRKFNKTPKIETEEVTVNIPKKLLAFVKDRRSKDLDEYLSNCLTDTIASDIDAGCFGHRDQILADYDLKAEFKFYEGH